jgi:two-component system, LytTR family, response regulator
VKLRALVVDDEDLPRRRVSGLVNGHADLTLVAEASDGAGALDTILAEKPDIVFLDIQMPELDGFEVVAALDDALPAIVFVTAYDEYALRAFEVGAFDYLLKPVTQERFDAAVARVVSRVSAHAEVTLVRDLASNALRARGFLTRFVARRGSRHYLVPLHDVDWLESDRNYVRIHAPGTTHLVRQTMKQIEARLDPQKFVRVHRSTIVAIDRITALESRPHGEYEIVLRDGARLASSRSYTERVRELIRGRAP